MHLTFIHFCRNLRGPVSEDGHSERGINLSLFLDENFSVVGAYPKCAFKEIVNCGKI